MKNLKLALILGLLFGSFNVFADSTAAGQVEDPDCDKILAQARTGGKDIDPVSEEAETNTGGSSSGTQQK